MSEWWTYRPADFLMFAPRTYWRLFELHNAAWWPAPPLLLLAGLAGLVVSVLGLFGDLSISLLKREAGMKDSGKLFPGHGGALDRLDSLIWSAAIVYYLVAFLGPLFPPAG